jgi:hypothetical protein
VRVGHYQTPIREARFERVGLFAVCYLNIIVKPI